MEKTTKAIIGLGSLAAISYFALAPKDKQEQYGTGAFGGGFGGEGLTGLTGDAGGDGSAAPAGYTFNFPTPDTSGLATFLGDAPQKVPEEQLMPKKTTLASDFVPSPLTPEAAERLAESSRAAAAIAEAGYGKTLFSPIKSSSSSKPQGNIFERVIGSVISPLVEEPRSVTAGKNIIAPVYENVMSDKKSWQGGTVKSGGFGSENVRVIPSGGSPAVTEQLQSSQMSKKEAAGQAAVKILESGAGKSLLPYSPTSSSSKKSTGSATVVKKVASEPAKKSWTLAEVKAGKNR